MNNTDSRVPKNGGIHKNPLQIYRGLLAPTHLHADAIESTNVGAHPRPLDMLLLFKKYFDLV